jgi:Arc/MetJ-type ribon-helix-helix transcriptional regulator
MKRKVTLVFHDEELYTQLKIEAVKRRTTASDIVSDAVREWLESREDAELEPVIESARAEWKEKGGRPWDELEQELAESVNRSEETPKARRV